MRRSKNGLYTAFAMCLFFVVSAAGARPPESKTGRPAFGFPKERTQVRPFPLEQVRLLDGPFKRARRRDRKYLLSIDIDRLLYTWRKTAGLPASVEPLGGWERPDCELRGHFLGHSLSACSLMYAAIGGKKLRPRTETVVSELATCQNALDGDGYISAFPESFINRALNSKTVGALLPRFPRCWPACWTHTVTAGASGLLPWRSLWQTGCTVGTSLQEHWGKPDILRLGGHTQEFCCTYNILKLTRHLTCIQPRAA